MLITALFYLRMTSSLYGAFEASQCVCGRWGMASLMETQNAVHRGTPQVMENWPVGPQEGLQEPVVWAAN